MTCLTKPLNIKNITENYNLQLYGRTLIMQYLSWSVLGTGSYSSDTLFTMS